MRVITYSKEYKLQTLRLCSSSDDGSGRRSLDLGLLRLGLFGLSLLGGGRSSLLLGRVLEGSNGSRLLDLGGLLLNLGGSRNLALGP